MKEEGLDKPYMGENRKLSLTGSFKDKLKETVNKIWKK
jgi:hypothetical protein